MVFLSDFLMRNGECGDRRCLEASMLALTEGQRLRGLIAISGIYSGPRFYRNWLTRHMPPA